MYTTMILLWLWPQMNVPEFIPRTENWLSGGMMIEKEIGCWYIGTSLQDCIESKKFEIQISFEY